MPERRPKIAAGVAAVRLLAFRPDLGRKRAQRRRAAALGAAIGRDSAACEVLAGWLATNTDQDVGDLESLLEDRVTVHLAGLAPPQRDAVELEDLRAGLALELGWKALRGHGPREVLKVLLLAGKGGTPRPTLERVARAGSGAVDDVLAACFAVSDGGRVLLGPGLTDFVATRKDPPGARAERVQRWLDGVRADLDGGVDEIEPAAARAMDFAREDARPDLTAALALSLAGRLRLRGDLAEAGERAAAGLAGLTGDEPRVMGLRAALELELALIAVTRGDPVGAERRLTASEGALAAAGTADRAGAAAVARRIAIARGQAELLAGRARRSVEALSAIPPVEDAVEVVRLQSLAAAHARAGDPGAARSAVEAAERAADAHLPADHPTRAGLELCRAQLDPSDRAERLERARVLAGGNLDRPATPALVIALHELGVSAARGGDTDLAGTLLDEATMLAASILPRAHPLRSTVAYTRALLFLALGEADRAERHLDRAIAGWERLNAGGHPDALLAEATRSWLHSLERGRRGDAGADALAAGVSRLAELDPDDPALAALRALPGRAP